MPFAYVAKRTHDITPNLDFHYFPDYIYKSQRFIAKIIPINTLFFNIVV